MSMVKYLGLLLSSPPSPLELTPQTLLLPGCSPHQPQSQDTEKSHCASQEMENVMIALCVKKKKYRGSYSMKIKLFKGHLR